MVAKHAAFQATWLPALCMASGELYADGM